VLTGSSDLLRLHRTPDSLAGRALLVQMRGLSQGEVRGRREDFVAWLAGARPASPDGAGFNPWNLTTAATRGDYVAALGAGGYPDIVLGDPVIRGAWLDSYIRQVTQRDSADVRRVTDPGRLASLLRLIAANQEGELVKARLAGEAGIPTSSITDFLGVLDALFLVEKLPSWTANLTGREIERPKAAVADSALALRLARVPPPSLAPLAGSGALGPFLEGFVASELAKQRAWSEVGYDLYHYRSGADFEVDIVVELDGGRVFGLEVKATQTVIPKHARGLRKFADRVGERFAGGCVLSLAPQGASFGGGIWALPIAALWEHPGGG
jgi:predicted AAA+ superfamily ATPase